ncbi:MAG: hypothetical protein FJ320_05955 [SAR202 cluster bacterium]|nr:hypothetical protein [SAR202 cluster bacterium]
MPPQDDPRLDMRQMRVQSTVGDILTNKSLRQEYREDPNKILDELLKDLPKAEQEQAKAEVKRKVQEVEEVFPGLSREEAKVMLLSSLDLPKSSFTIFTWLNVSLFGVGIGLLVLAAVVGLFKGQEQFTAMFGAGGLATTLGLFFIDPLKRISNAASDQSQLRTVVFGFWTQLANWRTEVLAPNDSHDFDTIKKVNAEVQKTMDHAAALLQKYVEAKIKEQPAPSDKEVKALQDRITQLEKKAGASA